MAFNEPLGAYLMSQVAEEAREELAESFGSLFQMIYIQLQMFLETMPLILLLLINHLLLQKQLLI
jgi:hypothetical protein